MVICALSLLMLGMASLLQSQPVKPAEPPAARPGVNAYSNPVSNTTPLPQRALLLCPECSPLELDVVSEAVTRRGGLVMILTPPDSALVRLHKNASKALVSEYPQAEVHYHLIEPAPSISPQSSAIVRYWNESLQGSGSDPATRTDSTIRPPDYNERSSGPTSNQLLSQHRVLEDTAPALVHEVTSTSTGFLSSLLANDENAAQAHLAPMIEAINVHSMLDQLLEQAQRKDYSLADFDVAVTSVSGQSATAVILNKSGSATAELHLSSYGSQWLIVAIVP